MNATTMFDNEGFIIPDWPAPLNVRALVSTRISLGKSTSATKDLQGYEHFNLALHVGDNPQKVLSNRQRLAQHLGVPPNNIAWLEQTHGTQVLQIETGQMGERDKPACADASTSTLAHHVCAIMTADCLPVLFCNIPNDNETQQVAATHAGWRGLADGILSETLSAFPHPENVIAWLGPAISQSHFEVGQEVYNAFVNKNSANAKAFIASPYSSTGHQKWLASLTDLATIELNDAGVKAVYGGEWCTYEQSELFYSFRRDGAQSGRIASLIMLG